MWVVVGGASEGLLVRRGEALDSAVLPRRLCHGTVVRELRLRKNRLEFELLEAQGEAQGPSKGPSKGWVSLRFKGRALLEKLARETPSEPLGLETIKTAKTTRRERVIEAKDFCGPAELDAFAMEKTLFYQSGGRWSSQKLQEQRGVAVASRVSVITPTCSERAEFHEQLWICFKAQTWKDKELVVVDSASTPSTFLVALAKEHGNVVYVWEDNQRSIGCKRNLAILLATGDVIVHFDDDDVYGPRYVEQMVSELRRRQLVALTLSAWYDFDLRLGLCGFVAPEELHEVDLLPIRSRRMRELGREAVEAAVYGYGFSYVYERSAAMAEPFADRNMCEDVDFFSRLRDKGSQVGLRRDEEGICLHVMHGKNTADSMLHRSVSIEKLHVCTLSLPFFHRARQPKEVPGRFFVKAETEQRMRSFQQCIEEEMNLAASEYKHDCW